MEIIRIYDKIKYDWINLVGFIVEQFDLIFEILEGNVWFVKRKESHD